MALLNGQPLFHLQAIVSILCSCISLTKLKDSEKVDKNDKMIQKLSPNLASVSLWKNTANHQFKKVIFKPCRSYDSPMVCKSRKIAYVPVLIDCSQNWFRCRILGIRQSIAFKYSSTDVITLSLRTNTLSSTIDQDVKPNKKQNK